MKFIAKTVTGCQMLAILAKNFILDVWLGSEYDSNSSTQIRTYTLSALIISALAKLYEDLFH